ncbi:MAG: 30S ribosomal protein S2 [Candidatus Komeilibacteria bacterium]|nr:30S ribosomal protein S2 [Candidatus Komeilibacteria bacterium]
MTKVPELSVLLHAGVHFGHQSSKRYPQMGSFIHSTRNLVDIINLEETSKKMQVALNFITETVARGGTVLFVSSKRQAKAVIEKHAVACGMPFVTARWLGGTFTNFASISRLVKTLRELEQKFAGGEMDKYTKKEQLDFEREMTRLHELVGGLKEMRKLPEAIFIVDIKKDKTATAEANKKNIPIVALVDSNVNPSVVQYAIPANDDAVKSIELITSLAAEAVMEGKNKVEVAKK